MTGSLLAQYLLQEKIGEGGMGVVYKARDTKLGRVVAIKVLPPEKVADPERKRRFIQEAQAASALNHPSIVTVYDVSADRGVDFIVMEYVPGKTLEQLIARKPAPVDVALKYTLQVADALTAAHAAGIIHRDLKPGNVMVNDEGRVKVLDFGLAKLTETTAVSEWDGTRTFDADSPRSAAGAIVGSASYMSPEQAEGRKVDPRSDIFAFGAVPITSFGSARAGSPRWSPDGERIVFDCNAEGQPGIYVVSASGGKPGRIENTGDAAVPSWSHDGKWIYFGSMRTGRKEIWKIPAAGGQPVQVTRHGGYTALETPDGKSLCFTKNDGPVSVSRISLADPENEKILTGTLLNRTFAVTRDGIWFISLPEEHRRYLRFRNFSNGATRTVAEIEKPVSWGLTVSPDGRSVLFAQVDQSGSDLMLINNFR